MKLFACSGVALALSAGLAMADGPITAPSEPQPAAPAPVAAYDWSGPYVGLSYGNTSADIVFSSGASYEFEDGTVAGVYAGYLVQRGAFVYGGELAYGSTSDTIITIVDEIERALDLKARLGYSANRALFYGVLGYSTARYSESAGIDLDLNGFSYGIGAEFAVSPRFTLGLEYLSRDLSGEIPGLTADANLDTLSLRAGFSF
ncbi:MAG: porin family protein [Tabrizicola sp.]|nr:porin family protein [Tabrizicola sp.]